MTVYHPTDTMPAWLERAWMDRYLDRELDDDDLEDYDPDPDDLVPEDFDEDIADRIIPACAGSTLLDKQEYRSLGRSRVSLRQPRRRR